MSTDENKNNGKQEKATTHTNTSCKVIRTPHGNTYYHCTSKDAFELPQHSSGFSSTKTKRLSAEEVNRTLNLNLGLPIDPWNPNLRKVLHVLVNACWWIEKLGIALWLRIPLKIRHWVSVSKVVTHVKLKIYSKQIHYEKRTVSKLLFLMFYSFSFVSRSPKMPGSSTSPSIGNSSDRPLPFIPMPL